MKRLFLIFLIFMSLFLPSSINAGLEFNGSNQYVGATSTFSFSAFTCLIRVYRHTTPPPTGWMIFINTASVAGTDGWFCGWYYGNLKFISGSSNHITGSTSSNNTWYNIAVVCDSSYNAIYVNGSVDVSGGGSNTPNAIPLRIASFVNMQYFDGIISDVSVYNRVLSPAEIKIVHNSHGSHNIVNGLIGRWLMNEKPDGQTATVANAVIDISTTGNQGSPVNSPTYRADILKTKKLIIHY